MKLRIHISIELDNLGVLKSVAHLNVTSEWVKGISEQIQAIYSLFLHFDSNFT